MGATHSNCKKSPKLEKDQKSFQTIEAQNNATTNSTVCREKSPTATAISTVPSMSGKSFVDPRSPSAGLARTPLAERRPNFASRHPMLAVPKRMMDSLDPRSPSSVPRSPVFHKSAKGADTENELLIKPFSMN